MIKRQKSAQGPIVGEKNPGCHFDPNIYVVKKIFFNFIYFIQIGYWLF